MTIDLTTDVGKVRLIIGDRDESNLFFSDAEISAYLEMSGSSVKRAAADALDTMASDQAFVLKQVSLLDISTNGPAVARALREHADRLRTDADAADAGDGELFDFAELNTNAFQSREILINRWLRDAA
jgi:hypothetical protein